jgi:hypothetical protein
MVVLDLIIKIISENVQELKIDSDSFIWNFTIECGHCFTVQPNEIYFTINDEVEMQKGHGTANFMMKCKECKKSMTVGINNKSNKSPYIIVCESGNDEGVLSSFECRGCTLKTWIPREGITFEAKESGTIFNEIDLSDVWCDYDEKTGMTVSILEPVTWRIEESK